MSAGKKHTLLIYNRTMRRVWQGAVILALLLFALWWFGRSFTSLYRPELDPIILGTAGYAAAFGLFAFFARRRGYVRAFDNYFLIATPFFRMKTSYKRVRGIRTVEFHRLFDLENLSWADERYVTPLIGETAVVVRLTDYPVGKAILHIFFHRYLISPRDNELVLLVPDWMALSLELDSRYNTYRQQIGDKMRKRALRGS